MPIGGKILGNAPNILLIAAGLAMAAGGAAVLSRVIATGNLVAAGNSVHAGAPGLSHDELRSTTDRLQAAVATRRTADETGAMTFLYYAAAQASLRAGDAATAAAEMASARRMARETLAMAPTRADISLTLAWIELATGQDRAAIDAALLLSYETAPRELWIIERRIWLGLRLASTATPELRAHIVNDIRTMGQPFRGAELYLELAEAARAAGIYAITLVRHELAAIHDQPLQTFNIDLARLDAQAMRKNP